MLSDGFWVQCKIIHYKKQQKKYHILVESHWTNIMENISQRCTEPGAPVRRAEQDGLRAGSCEIWKQDFRRCPFCQHGSVPVSGEHTGHYSWWLTCIPLKCNLQFQRWGPVNVAVVMMTGKSFLSCQCWDCLSFVFANKWKIFSPVYLSCFGNLFNNFNLISIILINKYILIVSKHWTFVFHMLILY